MDSFPINDLPEEVLQHIFSFLDVSDRLEACLVCKKWLNVVNCKYLLKNIIIQMVEAFAVINDITEINMSRNFLNFSFESVLIDDTYYEFFRHVSSTVEYFSFYKCAVKSQAMSFDDLSFENLRVLKVIDCDLWILFPNLPNLIELHLSGNSTITDNGIAILQKSMKSLKILSLYCLVNFDPKVYKRFYNKNISYETNPSPNILSLPALKSFISERVNTLKELNLYFNVNSYALEEISSIENLHLQKISLENCHNCIRSLIILFKNQPSLKSLNLNGIMGLNNNIMTALYKLLPNIEEINIHRGSFTDDSFSCVFQLKKLTKLDIGDNYASESGFSEAVNNFDPIYLKHLNVSGLKVKNIDLLIHKCKNLVLLDLSQCAVSDELLHFISENLIHLQDLCLKKTDITDYGLTGVEKMNLNENIIQEIDQKNHKLKPLSNLKSLKKLQLNYCEKITDYGIIFSVRFQNLQYLDLTGCFINHSTVETLLQFNPSLKKVLHNIPQEMFMGSKHAVPFV